MSLEAIKYKRGRLEILDQLLLPTSHEFVKIDDTTAAWNAIKKMQVIDLVVLEARQFTDKVCGDSSLTKLKTVHI